MADEIEDDDRATVVWPVFSVSSLVASEMLGRDGRTRWPPVPCAASAMDTSELTVLSD